MSKPTLKSTTHDSSADATRASVTFPAALYEALEGIARRKKVSVAWVVRDAAERYVAEQAAKKEK